MAPWLVEDDAARRRFVRESRLAASIEHANVIPIHAAGEHDGRAYIVMRYVEGSDLRELIRREGGLAPERAARIVAQVAAALDAAHRAGLVHRDVKPANVLLDAEEHAYLTDFGLTRGDWSSTGPRPTESGVFVGTSDYVAPEQIRGGAVDARADVYSLGAVLYHALVGEPPYAGRRQEAILWAHVTEPPPVPSEHPGVPRRFDDVIARAMAKRPADRYRSAGDLGRAAVAAATGTRVRDPERVVGVGGAAPGDSSQTVAAKLPGRPRRRWWPAAVVTAATAAAAVVGLTILDSQPRPPPASSPDATATSTPGPSEPKVRLIPMGGRPVSLAAAGDRVWALVGERTRLVSISPTTGKTRRVAALPRGGEELEAAGDDMYAAFDDPPQVLRLDARTGKRRAASEVFAGPTRRVDVGLGGVWVTERSIDETQPDHLLRLDPVTLATEKRFPMAHGARDVRTGGGALWVASRGRQEIVRVDPETGAVMSGLGAGNTPQEIAFGRRSLWAANDDDTVTRTPLNTQQKLAISVPGKPAGIEVRGRDVWVTALATNRLHRIDARRNEVVGQPVRVCVNPALLEVTASSVWTACVGDRRVAQVTYGPVAD